MIAIDFGTSRVKLAYFDPGRAEARLMELGDGQPCVPTLFYLDPDGDRLFGTAAHQMLDEDPAGVIHTIKRQFRSRVVRANRQRVPPVELVTLAFKHLRDRAGDELPVMDGVAPDRVTLTYPARFGPPEETLLRKAAQAAGFVDVELISEPEAAALAWQNQVSVSSAEVVVVLDCGGGTADWACLQRVGEGYRLLSEIPPGGDEKIGGHDLDEGLLALIRDHLEDEEEDGAVEQLDNRSNYYLNRLRRIKEWYCDHGRLRSSDKLRIGTHSIEVDIEQLSSLFQERFIEQLIQGFQPYLDEVRRTTDESHPTVLLVGGSGQVRGLKNALENRCDCKAVWWEKSEFATVLGAVHRSKPSAPVKNVSAQAAPGPPPVPSPAVRPANPVAAPWERPTTPPPASPWANPAPAASPTPLEAPPPFAPSAKPSPPPTPPAASTPESLDVVVTEIGGWKIVIVQELQKMTSLSPPDAEALISDLPAVVMAGVDPETAESARAKLQAMGAVIEIRPAQTAAEALALSASTATPPSRSESEPMDVVVVNTGPNRFNVVEEVQRLTGIGLIEAKMKVERLPAVISAGTSGLDAQKMKTALENAGAQVELRASVANLEEFCKATWNYWTSGKISRLDPMNNGQRTAEQMGQARFYRDVETKACTFLTDNRFKPARGEAWLVGSPWDRFSGEAFFLTNYRLILTQPSIVCIPLWTIQSVQRVETGGGRFSKKYGLGIRHDNGEAVVAHDDIAPWKPPSPQLVNRVVEEAEWKKDMASIRAQIRYKHGR